MKFREAGNMALHIVGGGVMAYAACWSLWTLVLSMFIYGWLREQAQHRYIFEQLTEDSEIFAPQYGIEKRPFFDFGWMKWHHVWEAGQWALGAAVAVSAWKLFGG